MPVRFLVFLFQLERFLITNRDDYLEHSSKNYTAEQKQYNNWLTERLLEVAEQYNYVFDPDDFNFVAIRDRYLAAEVIGVNLFKYRLMSFAVSSFFAGIAGALMAQNLEVITHESFTISQSVDYLAMCIIGGLGHIVGGIFGVGFWFILERMLEVVTTSLNSTYPDHITWFVSIREIVFGLVIILFLIFEPDGLAARWRTIRAYWKLWPFSY